MKKKSLITTLALTGGLLSLGLCLTSCDLSQNNTTTQTPISETTPTLPNPTDDATPSNQEGTLKQKILNSNSENEIINILGEYSLEEIELALKDEEVQNKITLSDQFDNLQVILSSVNDTLKQISNNVASFKTVVEEDCNYLEFDVVKKYNYSFYASNLENADVHIQNGIMCYCDTSSNSGSSPSHSTGTSSSSGASSNSGISGTGIGFNSSPSHSTGTGSSSGTSESSGVSSDFKQTALHFYNVSDVDISTYSYEDISRIYKTIKSVLTNDDNKLTLQSFNFDKVQLVESDIVYIKNINSKGRASNQETSTFTEEGDSKYSENSQSNSSSQSSSGLSKSTEANSLTGTSTSSTSGKGSSSGTSTSTSQSECSYYSIYEMQGTNDLTLHFKLEFDDNVSLEDMLNLININSSSFTVNLTNIYYK